MTLRESKWEEYLLYRWYNDVLVHWPLMCWYNNAATQYTGKGRNLTLEDIPALTDLLTDAFFNFGIDRSSNHKYICWTKKHLLQTDNKTKNNQTDACFNFGIDTLAPLDQMCLNQMAEKSPVLLSPDQQVSWLPPWALHWPHLPVCE